MRTLLLFCTGCLSSLLAAGQDTPTQGMYQSTRDLINLSGAKLPQTGTLFGFDNHRKQMLGTPYEDSTFQAGNVRFYGPLPGTKVDSLMGVPVRLELMAQQLEVLAGAGNIRVATAPQVRQFAVNNPLRNAVSVYINVREFRGDADRLLGFFEVLASGKATLLRYPHVSIKKASYNSALNVGTRDDEIVCKQTWYVVNGRKAVELSPGKRDVLALFPDKAAEMEAYLKQQKPDLKSRSGLAAVFEHYNSL